MAHTTVHLLPILALITCCTAALARGDLIRNDSSIWASPAVDLRNVADLQEIIDRLRHFRAVLVGEIHTEYTHHLVQLAIIQGLHRRGIPVTIGLEQIQQPFQYSLDDYLEGTINEREFLRRSEYFRRWGYDFRLYKPIFDYAREQGIPLVALNVPTELSQAVATKGLAGLDTHERAQLPAYIGEASDAYRQRLRAVYARHPNEKQHSFDHFVTAQLLWDEGMAAQAADYLKLHPDRHLVALVGNGHLEPSAVPERIKRRIDQPVAVVMSGPIYGPEQTMADFLIFPPEQQLPPKALLGLHLDTTPEGVTITGYTHNSAGNGPEHVRGIYCCASMTTGSPIRKM